jgi:hypothetical protein
VALPDRQPRTLVPFRPRVCPDARDYPTWRDAVLRAEDMGADAVFGHDHFHRPFVGLTSEGRLKEMLAWRGDR